MSYWLPGTILLIAMIIWSWLIYRAIRKSALLNEELLEAHREHMEAEKNLQEEIKKRFEDLERSFEDQPIH